MKKRNLVLLSLSALSLASLCVAVFKEVPSISVNAEYSLSDLPAGWEKTVEGDDDVYSFTSQATQGWDALTGVTENVIEVSLRNNIAVVDRNINLNVIMGGTTYTVDHRQDVGAIRLRINGGFDAYDKSISVGLDEWFTIKMAFYSDKILVYCNGTLFYNFATVIANPAAEKTINLSGWECKPSFKNIKVSNEEDPTAPTKDGTMKNWDSMAGIEVIGDTKFSVLNGAGVNHIYTGSLEGVNTIEYDYRGFTWDGDDRNIGLYFTLSGVTYGFRFDKTGTYFKNDTTGEVYCSAAVTEGGVVKHIKHVIDKNLIALYIDGYEIFHYTLANVSGDMTMLKYWNWNTPSVALGNQVINHQHVYHEVAEVGATCTADGVAAHYDCSCGKIFDTSKAETTLEALKIASSGGTHAYATEWSYNAQGHYHECANCHGADEVLPHVGDNWITTKEATRDEAGSKHRVCETCGYDEVVEIPKLPEKYDLGSNWKRTTEEGVDVYTANHASVGGFSAVTIASDVEANCFSVDFRHNTEVVDRNAGLIVLTGEHSYFLDYRQDCGAVRFRIDGGYDYCTYQFANFANLNEWFNYKMILSNGAVKCYVNDELAYDLKDERIVMGETATMQISTWETNVSFRNESYSKLTQEVVDLAVTNPTKLNYEYGEALDLTGLAVSKVFNYGDNEVATEADYEVTGYDPNTVGKQTITVTCAGKSKTFEVKVNDTITSIEITPPTKLTYKYNEELDIDGLLVNSKTASGATAEVSPLDYEVSGYDKTVLGTQTITVTAGDKTATFDVVVENYTTDIEVTAPTKLVYENGEALDLTGLVVKSLMADGSKVDVDLTNAEVTGFNADEAGTQTITVTVGEFSKTFEVTVNEKEQPSEQPSEEPSEEPSQEPSEEVSSEESLPSEKESTEDPLEPTPEKKGCGAVASSSLIGLIGLLGAFIFKRRH